MKKSPFWICWQEVEDKEKRGQTQILLIGDEKEEGWSKEEKGRWEENMFPFAIVEFRG